MDLMLSPDDYEVMKPKKSRNPYILNRALSSVTRPVPGTKVEKKIRVR